MSDVTNFLKENPIQYLSTMGLDGNAKVRPVMFYFEENNKLFFCTSNEKPMYKELSANPNFELVVASPEFVWCRISGKAEFTDDLEIKQKVIDSSEIVKNLYQTNDNPTFEVFYIKDGKATIRDFSGEPPKKYNL
jgi:uncharacterized pyridoxamine 5'-phosphate oxidase family protein